MAPENSPSERQGPEGSAGNPLCRGVPGGVLGVFAKHWTPGETKTRLAATIEPERAAHASRAFFHATCARLQRVAASLESVQCIVACTPPERVDEFRETLGPGSSWQVVAQPEGDLGQRMRWFFDRVRRPDEWAVLLGTDSPDFPETAVRDAIGALRDPAAADRAVIGPSEDGGYWLIGARGRTPPVFDALPWSQPDLFERTEQRLREHQVRGRGDYLVVRRWYDVDTDADLRRLLQSPTAEDPALARLHAELSEILGHEDRRDPGLDSNASRCP